MSNFVTCDCIDACAHVDAKWFACVLVMRMLAMLPVLIENDTAQTYIVKGNCNHGFQLLLLLFCFFFFYNLLQHLSHDTRLFSFRSGPLLSDWPGENMVFGDRYWTSEFALHIVERAFCWDYSGHPYPGLIIRAYGG